MALDLNRMYELLLHKARGRAFQEGGVISAIWPWRMYIVIRIRTMDGEGRSPYTSVITPLGIAYGLAATFPLALQAMYILFSLS